MIVTRSMSAGKNTNAHAIVAASGNNANHATVSTNTKKLDRAERRRLETLTELSELGVTASVILDTKRQRRQAQHPDLAFYRAAAIQAEDAGKRGGLITRSKHHYERDIRII